MIISKAFEELKQEGIPIIKDMDIEQFYQSEVAVDGLFRSDFYFPSLRMVLEVNGVDHFYPYVSQSCNYTNFKTKILNLVSKSAHFEGPKP
jgi:hypothetical protein